MQEERDKFEGYKSKKYVNTVFPLCGVSTIGNIWLVRTYPSRSFPDTTRDMCGKMPGRCSSTARPHCYAVHGWRMELQLLLPLKLLKSNLYNRTKMREIKEMKSESTMNQQRQAWESGFYMWRIGLCEFRLKKWRFIFHVHFLPATFTWIKCWLFYNPHTCLFISHWCNFFVISRFNFVFVTGFTYFMV